MADANEAFEALKKGDVAKVKALLAAHPSLVTAKDGHGVSLLLQARYRHLLPLVDQIRAAHPGIDLYEACAIGDTKQIALLLDAKKGELASYSADGYTPLHLAAFFGHLDATKLLVERGANVAAVSTNPMKVTPLHSAAAGESVEVVELLLAKGADPNARQHGGFMPLQSAASNGNVAMVKALLAKGADPSLASDDGRTAQDLARAQDNDEVLALFE
jgi:ankyrin repeat protein